MCCAAVLTAALGLHILGNQTAQYHDKVARAWLKQRGIEVPGGLNYLEIDSAAGQEYLQARLVPHAPALCWKFPDASAHLATVTKSSW